MGPQCLKSLDISENEVSIQLIAPASGAHATDDPAKHGAMVSIQLIAPASGAEAVTVDDRFNHKQFPFN